MNWLQRACFCFGLLTCPHLADALQLELPSVARQTAERVSAFDGYAMPTGPFADGQVPSVTFEGAVERLTWRIDSGSSTTLQTLAPLRDQLLAAGFTVLFECGGRDCGGFDFRFGTEVVPAPDMHVDIQDFRFLSADANDGRGASLLVSRSRGATYIQAIIVTPAGVAPVVQEAAPATAKSAPKPVVVVPAEATPIARQLLENGHAVLSDLAFAPGGSNLEERAYASLKELAAFLAEYAEGTLVLVGHTDTVGDLATNIRLSKRRAEAVRTLLIGMHNVSPERVEAEGNGYLSPIASNLTPEGREANRRVEVMLKP